MSLPRLFLAAFAVAASLAPAIGPASAQSPSTATPQIAAPSGPAAQPHRLRTRFEAANTTHDNRLTLAQAQAGMPMVARHFDMIDADHKGYVTLQDIQQFARRQSSRPPGPRPANCGADGMMPPLVRLLLTGFSKLAIGIVLIGALAGCACRPGYVGPYGGVHPTRCWIW